LRKANVPVARLVPGQVGGGRQHFFRGKTGTAVELGLNNPQWILSLLAQPAERRAQRIGLCPVHDKVDTIVERHRRPTVGGNPVPLNKRAARAISNRALEGRL
jgi:hypothetical protein